MYKRQSKDTDDKTVVNVFTVNFVKSANVQSYQLSLPTEDVYKRQVLFTSIVKYNVVGAWDFQQMLAVQPLGTVNQFPVQIRIIQKSKERHIRVIGTLMFL